VHFPHSILIVFKVRPRVLNALDQLANKGGQIGPKKIRVYKWLTDNEWDIVQTVVSA
jgi:hypothetical protein